MKESLKSLLFIGGKANSSFPRLGLAQESEKSAASRIEKERLEFARGVTNAEITNTYDPP